MAALDLICVTARTVTVLLSPETARFSLPSPVEWRLEAQGVPIARGQAAHVPLFVEGLSPETEYRLSSALGELVFTTKPCAGLIDASSFGVSPEADAKTNAEALACAIEAVPEGGTLTLPPGRYETLPLFLKAQMTLYLPEGTTLSSPASRRGWPQLPARDGSNRVVGSWEGLPERCFAALITGIDAHGLILTGRGVIDGGGDRGDWWSWPKETREGARRPRTLHLIHSDDVQLSGLTVRNSPSWTIHPYRCDRMVAAALSIENPPDSPNTDGLDPESCLNMQLVGLDFSVGDDCIAVKAGKRAPGQADHLAPTRDLTIHHCRMARGHGAVVLGSEMSGSITDVHIEACAFIGTDRGLRLKTRRGRGGEIARVRMVNVEMDGVGTAFSANGYYFCDADGKSDAVQNRAPAPVDETTPRIFDIRVENVTARGVKTAAVALLGLSEAPFETISLSEFRVSYDPAAEEAVPLMACDVPPVRHGGIIAEFADLSGQLKKAPPHKDEISC